MTKTQKTDVFTIVTDTILDKLEQGTIPWRKEWRSKGGEFQFPVNLRSKKAYRGINILLLNMMGYDCKYWMTFNQAKELSGYKREGKYWNWQGEGEDPGYGVKKGEKATLIIYWNWVKAEKKDAEGKPVVNEAGEPVVNRRAFLRYFKVFNAQQCNLPEGLVPAEPVDERTDDQRKFQAIESCEQVTQNLPKPAIEVRHGGDKAFYSPALDYVGMPHQIDFESDETYYGTLFHELVHATSHHARCARKGKDSDNKDSYSKEELVAEMGAAFLCGLTGIDSEGKMIENQAAYIAHWREKLQQDKKVIVYAAAQAQKAVDWLTSNVTKEETVEETA